MLTDAANIPHARLCAAMNEAFSDYAAPMQLSQEAFSLMMRQRGLTPSASRIAMIDGQIAAIWLVSIRSAKAYLISSGTRPAFRGQGLAKQLAASCLEGLRAAGITSFQTEVMDGNASATPLYFKLGMAPTRGLDCYNIPAVQSAPQHPVEITDWGTLAPEVSSLRTWHPSWQNSDASLAAVNDTLLCARVVDAHGLAGYAAVIKPFNTLAQIAVRPDRRRQGIASALIAHLQAAAPDLRLRITNAEAGDAPFAEFMRALNATPTVSQRELHMSLNG